MENKTNLIGSIVLTSNTMDSFDHDYDDNEDSDDFVTGMIIEKVSDEGTYLVMDDKGRVYITEYTEIDKIISFGGNPSTYIKRQL